MKKFLVWVSLAALLLAFAGCSAPKNTKKNAEHISPDTVGQTEPAISQPQERTTFKRVKTVTIHNDYLETGTYEIIWDGDRCSFTMTEYGWDPCLTDAFYDVETGAFSVHRKPTEDEGGGVTDVTLCFFDEQGRIVNVTRGSDMKTFGVSYDEDGWPQGDALTILGVETDKEKKQYSYHYAGMTSSDMRQSCYKVITVDSMGNAIKVDSREVSEYNTGKTEESLEENIEHYTYDEDGNLLKYEAEHGYVEFTYTDEPIYHNWERLIPFLCYDFSQVYTAALFWNL